MTHESDDELLARLRAVDPASSLPAADPDRVARLLEDTMDNDLLTESRETGARHRGPLTWLVAAAAALIIAGAGVFAVLELGDDTAGPPTVAEDPTGEPTGEPAGEPTGEPTGSATVTELSAPASAAYGRCMVPNVDTLGGADLAFAGTVDDITDGLVTLSPTRWYAGTPTDEVTVADSSPDLQALIGAVDFRVGQSFLVAASADGDVFVCGFTGPEQPPLTDLYAQAFDG